MLFKYKINNTNYKVSRNRDFFFALFMSLKKKIAIQGIKGSFHHQVANQYFGDDIILNECLSFVEIPELINDGAVDGAVMAIENSLAGSILPNYALIDEYNLKIQGEVHLPIHHHLMALNHQTIADIREVWSHPMAILQCRKFFRSYPHIKLVEASDTAEAVSYTHLTLPTKA